MRRLERSRWRRWWALAVAFLCAVATSCGSYVVPGVDPNRTVFPATSVAGFVSAEGSSFTVDGNPFRFVGVNIYDAAASDFYSCDPDRRMSDAELRSTLKTLRDSYGVTVVRFWAYQTYTKSATDFSALDAVISAARDNGIRLLPVLEDGPGYCSTGVKGQPKRLYGDDDWYADGYRAPYGSAALSYRDYVQRVVSRYKDEPVVFGWSLMNEADTTRRNAQGRSVLVDFASDVGALVKQSDSNHLLTLGTQSNGAPGASGPDFTAVYSLPVLDFAEVHDWAYWGDDANPLPGGTDGTPPAAGAAACQQLDAAIGCSFAQLPALAKPLLVGEAGMGGGDAAALQQRADRLGAKIDAAFAAGAGGYLLWRVVKNVTEQYDITLGSGDPLLGRLAQVAKAVGTATGG